MELYIKINGQTIAEAWAACWAWLPTIPWERVNWGEVIMAGVVCATFLFAGVWSVFGETRQ